MPRNREDTGMEILYGVESEELDAVAEALEVSLGERFQPRESSYLGDYWQGRSASSKIRVVSQRDAHGEAQEPEFGGYGVLVYVEGPSAVPGVDGLETPAGGVRLLRER
ncbi:MAG TPA: hypothetical protein VKZ65_07375 [Glycomyces sp.]|nr:hypothetical protein [Glycomyces sp.]